jgi:digeranylgeranylglycerophospholipid reductase
MALDFEVIIVGAGPAGAMMAKLLAEKNFSVCVVEKEFEVGYPNKSTAATPIDTFKVFNLPDELGYSDIYSLRLFGPSKMVNMRADRILGRVLKFRETKQYLIKQAIKHGAVVIPGSEVIDFKRKENLVGVSYKGYQGKGMVWANVVVDASGPKGVLSTKLGLWKKDEKKLGVAFEYFMENANPEKIENGFFLDIYLGSKVAPGGYAWIFPTGNTQVKAGICKLRPTTKVKNEKTQVQYFNDLWRKEKQIKNAQPFEIHDCAHYITGGEKKGVLDNFIAIGDAVNKVNPLFGEGVRASFYSATFAAEAIEEARKHKDYSQKTLSIYEEKWKKKWGLNWTFARIMFEMIYSVDDKQLDELISTLGHFDTEVMYNLYVGKAKTRDYFKFLKSLPRVINPRIMATFFRSLV